MKKIFLLLIVILATLSINAEVIKVYENGSLSATYTNTPTQVVKVIFEGAPAAPEHEYVDLGLSVKWATCNVGAENCYDYGNYFAWGETTGYDEGKTNFSWSTHTLCQGSQITLTKYCSDSNYGSVDNKTVLEASDDAATANWGSAWRMPTYDELSELINTSNCSWTWYDAGHAEFNGVPGYKVRSLKEGYTDKYIFLPAAGYRSSSTLINAGTFGYYWSSSLREDYSIYARGLSFFRSDHWTNGPDRVYGYSIRPVRASDKDEITQIVKVYVNGELTATYTNTPTNTVEVVFEDEPAAPEHEYVDLGLSVKWATCNVGAEHCYDYGNYFAWGETTGYDEGKTDFSWSTYTLCQGSYYTMTKYCTSSAYGTVDNKTVLEASDDAATANWGSAWRMPTYAEQSELLNTSNCSWTWYAAGNDEFNGVEGYKVQSLKAGYTDKYIFLPAAGMRVDSSLINGGAEGRCGCYWSSWLEDNADSDAIYLVFRIFGNYEYFNDRRFGMSVRPVLNTDK